MTRITESHVPCRGGCGKLVNNSTDTCRDCRRVKCKLCAKPFSPERSGAKFCGECKRDRNQKVENNGGAHVLA